MEASSADTSELRAIGGTITLLGYDARNVEVAMGRETVGRAHAGATLGGLRCHSWLSGSRADALIATLGVATMSAAQTKGTYLAAKYRRVAAPRVPIKAIVALEHAMPTAIRHVPTTDTTYAVGFPS
jgi:hypothetical protein